ncbi:MAG: VWA domain-containing protein [Polyangiaceae bacterium]
MKAARPSRSAPRALLLLMAALLALPSLACAGLNVKLVNGAQKKPNNVWVFFTVMDGKDPVGGLTADDFTIKEDGQVVSKFESKQVIQNPDVAAVMYTMLLVDMSGSITDSGQADQLVDAAKSFAERVGKTQKVGVYAFDGDPKIHSVVPFTEAQGSVQGGLEGLRKYKPKDPSTNLHGAVVEGLRELKKELDKDKRPLKFGTLVVFSDGTDRAARVTRDEMKDEIGKDDYEDYQMFAIGVGAEIEKANLGDIGRDGTELAQDQSKVKEVFDRVAGKIEQQTKRFYLLSYCTPARKGEHEVTVDATRPNPKDTGSLDFKFNADGFGPPPDCNPNTPPTFDLKKVTDPASGGGSGGASAGGSVTVKGGASAGAGTKKP